MTNRPFSNWNSIAAPSTVTLVFRRRPITNYCELNPRADTSIPTFGITSTSPSSTLRQAPARITDPPFHDNHPRTRVRPISLPEKPCGIRLKPATTYSTTKLDAEFPTQDTNSSLAVHRRRVANSETGLEPVSHKRSGCF